MLLKVNEEKDHGCHVESGPLDVCQISEVGGGPRGKLEIGLPLWEMGQY